MTASKDAPRDVGATGGAKRKNCRSASETSSVLEAFELHQAPVLADSEEEEMKQSRAAAIAAGIFLVLLLALIVCLAIGIIPINWPD